MAAAEPEPPRRRVRWRTSIRIIPSRFPPVDLFQRIAPPADFAALQDVEALTNDRVRQELGAVAWVPVADRVSGPGASYIMAAFTHPNPDGSRFSDGSFGVYYAARERVTAVAETTYHRARFLAWTREPPIEIEMRVLEATLQGELHDIRGLREEWQQLYHPDDYSAPRRLGVRLRRAGARGIVYESVRRAGGQCAAVLRPRVLSGCRQAEHLVYVWDGRRIAHVFEKKLYLPPRP